ncbi:MULTISPECIES: acyltransferase [unclassified Crossiella]|uniref:acyltransferase family protein n=1 Tax=unclassified Crossiella TaxID=2620835 RepID=UPI001FFE9B61|nr:MULTISPECIES: acyltransferase [unclassified Crossiella]MCK2240809.1 acyltransferase [Crossiella sp. S99.2]MCK2254047.1 acyltransferase [Crossiella sp. S99.1]
MSSMGVRGATPVGTGNRNAVVDLVRLTAVGMVVLLHWISPVITVTNGAVKAGIAFSGPVTWVATWFLQVMPLVFIAGGFVNTAGVDATVRKGQSAVTFLARRARRLVTPTLPLVGICAALATAGSLLGQPAIAIVGDQAANPLWFLAVYLVVVALAPLMVRLHDRFGLAVPAVLTLAVAAVDTYRFATVGLAGSAGMLGDVSLVLVWVTVHQLGIVLARGGLARFGDRGLLGVAGVAVAGIVALIVFGPYPPAPIGLPDVPVSNLAPPTVLMVLLGIAQVALLARFTPWLERRLDGARTRKVLQRGNSTLMTVYLWHIPAALLVAGVCLLAPELLLPQPGAAWWSSRPMWLLACGLVLFALVKWLRHFETGERENRRSGPVSAPLIVLGTVCAAFGLHEIFLHGLDLAAQDAAGSWRGVLALGVGAVLLRAAERAPSSSAS